MASKLLREKLCGTLPREYSLGFALELCAFRYPGRLLAVGESIPLNVLGFIATQLGTGVEDLDGYAIREETRREHLAELRRIYGYRMFSGRCARDLKVWLEHEAEGAPSNEGLVRRFVEECRRRQVILPGLSVLEHLCTDALVAAERRMEARIAGGLDDALRMDLGRLLTEEVDGSVPVSRRPVGWDPVLCHCLVDGVSRWALYLASSVRAYRTRSWS